MDEKRLNAYAKLLVTEGVNLQPGEKLYIRCDVTGAYFARKIAEYAYSAGAFSVTMLFHDQEFTRLRYGAESEEALAAVPEWLRLQQNGIAEERAAYIGILQEDPELLSSVDPKRVAIASRAKKKACEAYYKAATENRIKWCLAAIPHPAWAKKVYPEMSEEKAVDALWEAIALAMRLNEPDPAAAWEKHQQNLKRRIAVLNGMKIRTLRYKNALGTDFCITLPQNYYFAGGSELSEAGCPFTANMPTEEVFTCPDFRTAEGTVVASLPLSHNGKTVKNFRFTFHEGKVVDFDAEEGKEVLAEIMKTDEGASYLGEVALVPYDSPIQNLKTLFYETLFDENASCHLALGAAYPCVTGAEKMTDGERKAAGINDSMEHVDFMVGTKDLSIDAETESGEILPVFRDGNFVF